MRSFDPRKLALATMATGAVVALCLGAAAWMLRFELDRFLFLPAPPPVSLGVGTVAFRLAGPRGAAMIVRRFDPPGATPRLGCVVFFPGRGGGVDREARDFFPSLQEAGLAVYAAAYPGQDGAPGRARADEVRALAVAAATAVTDACGRHHTVVVGHSLGAMVAAYAAGAVTPAGLVMTSASPSLSAGVRGALRAHWFLRPLALLPIERLVAHDFSIAEAVPADLHVALFQGSADDRTPLADFRGEAGGPDRLPIFEVAGGTHADTPLRAEPAMISAMLGMIRGSDEAAASEAADE